MSLSKEEIQKEVEAKGYTLVSADGYKNLTSSITVKCKNGHTFSTDMNSIRHPSFSCPLCAKQDFVVTAKPHAVPEKNGYRIIAFDQATYKMGLSIYDNGKLVYWDLFQFTDYLLANRLRNIQRLLEEVVIPIWKPDFIVFEDIQEQGGFKGMKTFKILAELLGVCETTAQKYNIEYECLAPVVWRKSFGAVSGGREKEKVWAVNKVRELTGLNIEEDTAEAILIGYSETLKHKSKQLF